MYAFTENTCIQRIDLSHHMICVFYSRWNPLHRITPDEALKHPWMSTLVTSSITTNGPKVPTTVDTKQSNGDSKNGTNKDSSNNTTDTSTLRKSSSKPIQALSVKETETGK